MMTSFAEMSSLLVLVAAALLASTTVTAEEGASSLSEVQLTASVAPPADDAPRSSYAFGSGSGSPPEWLMEEPCTRAGGICMHVNECGGSLSEKPGLCPKQRAKGVECCHGLSVLETRCRKRGGECMVTDQCNPRLRDSRATDCSYGESCCILVAL
ncbi:U-scoloptoxin(19)-Sm1a [Frankliniella occidentalis]|uniref:U-scoloptoxin(19)-Sm1a n=1 Tax=Frankliniella occidentalis TaxID=133901 RepID=A0A6J1T359_FRAOC|nr:U-scoloptoxin(19)-Sm1a [Frankliniella occidentalis]